MTFLAISNLMCLNLKTPEARESRNAKRRAQREASLVSLESNDSMQREALSGRYKVLLCEKWGCYFDSNLMCLNLKTPEAKERYNAKRRAQREALLVSLESNDSMQREAPSDRYKVLLCEMWGCYFDYNMMCFNLKTPEAKESRNAKRRAQREASLVSLQTSDSVQPKTPTRRYTVS
jgi:hypothetical protein